MAGQQVMMIVFLKHVNQKHMVYFSQFHVFPERLGEGRFLGAVSLSSLT